ncbi:hypothetical protein Tco_1180861, partial [Tanacetum coccineum]
MKCRKFVPSRPIDKDQANKKAKAGTSSTSLATAFDVESLAKLMANEYAMASESYNAKKEPGRSYCRSKAGAGTQGCGAENLTNEKPSKRRSFIY